MIHRRLFSVRVVHEFFDGAPCPDVQIEARASSPRGARALARHRLLARPRPDGFEVLGPLADDATPLVAFTDDLGITLDLRTSGPDFIHYTDSTPWEQTARPTYRGSSPAGGALTLGSGDAPHPSGVAATVELTGITAAWLAQPPAFTLELHARAARWVYYLLTARPDDALPLVRNDEPGRELAFERVALLPGEVDPAVDPVGHRLVARHPGRRCFRFTSDRPLACRRAPLRRLALLLGEELLIRELPNPAIDSHATLVLQPGEPPRDTLFRVIEY